MKFDFTNVGDIKLSVSVLVVWQSLAERSYRTFFYDLARIRPWRVGLVSSKKIHDSNAKLILADPPDVEPELNGRVRFFALPSVRWEGQANLFLGLRKVVLRFFSPLPFAGKRNVLFCMAEPYSFSALWAWLISRGRHLEGRHSFFILFAPQNFTYQLSLPLRLVQSFLLKRTDVIATTSRDQEKVLRQAGYEGPVIEFPPWIDDKTFRLRDREQCWQELATLGLENKTPERIRIAVVDGLNESSRATDLLTVLKENAQEYKEYVELFLVSNGTLQEIDLLAKEVSDLGIPIHQISSLDQDQIAMLLNCSDILVSPNQNHSNSNEYAIGASACGCLVVAVANGIPQQVFDDKRFLFQEQNSESMHRALLAAISQIKTERGDNNSEGREENRRRRSEKVVDEFTAKASAERFSNALLEIID